MKRITIKDVAEVAGVSPSAVSRAFTAGASVSAETRARVSDAAVQLGYHPSKLARGLTGSRTNLITVVFGGVRDPFDALLLDHLSRALAQADMQLMLINTASTDTFSETVLARAVEYSSDALIISAGTVPEDQAEICIQAGLPVIMIGREAPSEGVDAVLIDNERGGALAAQFFMDTGRVNPAFLSKPTPTFSNQKRLTGFMDVWQKAGYDVLIETPDAEDEQTVFNAAMRLLYAPQRPDAVFCSNDYLAMRLIEAAALSGIRIPNDMAVIGFNDLPQARLPFYQLTSLHYSVEAIVSQTLRLLDRRLADPRRETETVTLAPELILRASSHSIRRHDPDC